MNKPSHPCKNVSPHSTGKEDAKCQTAQSNCPGNPRPGSHLLVHLLSIIPVKFSEKLLSSVTVSTNTSSRGHLAIYFDGFMKHDCSVRGMFHIRLFYRNIQWGIVIFHMLWFFLSLGKAIQFEGASPSYSL